MLALVSPNSLRQFPTTVVRAAPKSGMHGVYYANPRPAKAGQSLRCFCFDHDF